MFYQSQRMKLECVRVIRRNEINDILICRDINTAAGILYTLLVIKEHQIARKYLEVFENADMAAQDSYIESFSDHGFLCMVFEYKQERRLKDFYMGTAYTLAECENVCINVIMACITSALPYPLLYLILEQNQLNLSKDHMVYFSYQIDLTQLDPNRTERDCVGRCAEILRELLRPKASQKAFSYRILEKKISRESYDCFTELYKDIRITAVPEKRKGLGKRASTWFAVRKDKIFQILLFVGAVLALIVLVSLAFQLFLGDIPWLRVLFNGFKTIGTESLLR